MRRFVRSHTETLHRPQWFSSKRDRGHESAPTRGFSFTFAVFESICRNVVAIFKRADRHISPGVVCELPTVVAGCKRFHYHAGSLLCHIPKTSNVTSLGLYEVLCYGVLGQAVHDVRFPTLEDPNGFTYFLFVLNMVL